MINVTDITVGASVENVKQIMKTMLVTSVSKVIMVLIAVKIVHSTVAIKHAIVKKVNVYQVVEMGCMENDVRVNAPVAARSVYQKINV